MPQAHRGHRTSKWTLPTHSLCPDYLRLFHAESRQAVPARHARYVGKTYHWRVSSLLFFIDLWKVVNRNCHQRHGRPAINPSEQ